VKAVVWFMIGFVVASWMWSHAIEHAVSTGYITVQRKAV
jgi:hypothetical protein